MSATFWVLIAGGVWLVVIGTLRICADVVKDVDRAQSELLAAHRRDRFAAPEPRELRRAGAGGWTRAGG